MNLLTLGLPRSAKGSRIVAASAVTTAVYCAALGWDLSGLAGGDEVAVAIALGWFAVSLGVWAIAFGTAVVRSTRGDDIAVASLFFLQGSAPSAVRARLLGVAAFVLVVTIATLAVNPVGFLVNMLPIGFTGLWGARHGVYPERTDPRYTGRTDGRLRQRAHPRSSTR